MRTAQRVLKCSKCSESARTRNRAVVHRPKIFGPSRRIGIKTDFRSRISQDQGVRMHAFHAVALERLHALTSSCLHTIQIIYLDDFEYAVGIDEYVQERHDADQTGREDEPRPQVSDDG